MGDVTIYHLEGRRCERIVWLMEELGLPYELVFKRGDLMGSMALVREVNPTVPMAPTVKIDGQIMVESGAIIDLILARMAPDELRPPVESADYPLHLMWMHYAEGTLAARVFSDYRAFNIQPPKSGGRSRLVDTEACVQFAEDHLAKYPWFGGADFSAADIMMVFPLDCATGLRLVDVKKFPAIAAWKEKVRARPAYQRMLEKARPDGLIGALPPVKKQAEAS